MPVNDFSAETVRYITGLQSKVARLEGMVGHTPSGNRWWRQLITTKATVDASAYYLGVTAGTAGTAVTLYLPHAGTAGAGTAGGTPYCGTGAVYVVKDESGSAGSYPITIAGTAGQLIDGAGTVGITHDYGAVTLISDGTAWHVVDGYKETDANCPTSWRLRPALTLNAYLPGGGYGGGMACNAKYCGGSWTYLYDGKAALLFHEGTVGRFSIYTAGSGVAGSAVSWSQKFQYFNEGGFAVGTCVAAPPGIGNFAISGSISAGRGTAVVKGHFQDNLAAATFSAGNMLRLDGYLGTAKYVGIGFHYAGGGAQIPPVFAGVQSQQLSTYGNADYVIATRPDQNNVEPTERLRVTRFGSVGIGGSPTQALDVYGNMFCSGSVSTNSGTSFYDWAGYTTGTVVADGYITVTINGTAFQINANAV